MEERRFQRRFDLKLPCRIRASGPDGEAHHELVTDNIGCGGASFSNSSPYPVGTHLNIQISIRRSSQSDSRSPDGCVSVQGEVLRADDAGMAVEFDDQYRIFRVSRKPRQTPSRSFKNQAFNLNLEPPASVSVVPLADSFQA